MNDVQMCVYNIDNCICIWFVCEGPWSCCNLHLHIIADFVLLCNLTLFLWAVGLNTLAGRGLLQSNVLFCLCSYVTAMQTFQLTWNLSCDWIGLEHGFVIEISPIIKCSFLNFQWSLMFTLFPSSHLSLLAILMFSEWRSLDTIVQKLQLGS